MKKIASLFLLLSLCQLAAFADDEKDKDHHHEDLTETQLGTVHFPVSCAASVQQPFQRGVALLHSFWYEEAEKEFLDIAKDDPKCAMAHWGVAMSLWHQLWNQPDAKMIARGEEEIKAGHKLQKNATVREQAYLDAVKAFYSGSKKRDYKTRAAAYSGAMKKTYETNPDDHEAAAFYALSLLASDENMDHRKQAAAVLEKLFAIEPDHPGVAHYLIHTYDTPAMAELGIPAARRYAQIAPAAPHALHMPSHIFARVGLWQDDINSNLASVAATRKTAAMGMGGEGHQFHAMDFLVYAYLQSGRESEAQTLIEEVKAMPPMHDRYGMGTDPRTYALIEFPANYAMELHHWNEAAALPEPLDKVAADSSVTYWARAIGAARSGNVEQAKRDLAQIDKIHQKSVADKKTDVAEVIARDYQEASAWVQHADGKDDEALATLRKLANETDKDDNNPETISAREMLADLLLELKRPQEALLEYQADLKLRPKRFNGLYGAARAAEEAGKQSEANTYYATLLKSCEGGSSMRPELSHAKELVAQK
jgi:tetratricopeptide (TPR) repeat protein